jgi:hypothetical protein
MNDIKVAEWQVWPLPLSDFTDDNPSLELDKMQTLYIGFGTRFGGTPGGNGEVYFDNILLYQPICIPSRRSAAFAKLDFDEDCIIGFGDVEFMSSDWLESDINLGEVTNPTDTNLVGWWKLDDGDGNIATDSSVYSNHGTVETNTVKSTTLLSSAVARSLCRMRRNCDPCIRSAPQHGSTIPKLNKVRLA